MPDHGRPVLNPIPCPALLPPSPPRTADPKRFVSLEDVRGALVEVREVAKRQADEAVAAVSAAAAARHEALQAEHAGLSAKVRPSLSSAWHAGLAG